MSESDKDKSLGRKAKPPPRPILRLSRFSMALGSLRPSLLRRMSTRTWIGDQDLKGAHKNRESLLALAFSSLGVIYGDIGTSPLYVYSTVFSERSPSPSDVLGSASLIVWILFLIVVVKYVLIVLRADNNGEGGTFSLYSQLCNVTRTTPYGPSDAYTQLSRGSQARIVRTPWLRRFSLPGSRIRRWMRGSNGFQKSLLVGVCVAIGLVLADGVLTPAQSVLSAVSGLGTAPGVSLSQGVVVAVTCVLLVLLFAIQRFGTHAISIVFAPIIALWLGSNATIGLVNMAQTPGGFGIFRALAPYYGIKFLVDKGNEGWRMLAGIFLAITGAEALFADLGHFSRPSIQLAFISFVFPCLVVTYLGQASFLMHSPDTYATIYWSSIPKPVYWPMLVLATLATLVASQALITASFSIARQAMHLNLLPKMKIHSTSLKVEGQIYIGAVNWTLAVLCVAAVAGFRDSVRLANAYGVAVSMDMNFTNILMMLIMVTAWELSFPLVLLYGLCFCSLEGTLLSANLIKVPHGGWFPLSVAVVVASILLMWYYGSVQLKGALDKDAISPADLFRAISARNDTPNAQGNGNEPDAAEGLALAINPGQRMRTVPGMAIFYTDSVNFVPPVLLHYLKNVPVLHAVSVFLTIRNISIPNVAPRDRLLVREVPGSTGIFQVVARYGYADTLDHGPDFISSVVQAVKGFLHGGNRVEDLPEHPDDQEEQAPARRLTTFESEPDVDLNDSGRQVAELETVDVQLQDQSTVDSTYVPEAQGSEAPVAADPEPPALGLAHRPSALGLVQTSVTAVARPGQSFLIPSIPMLMASALADSAQRRVVYYTGSYDCYARRGSNAVNTFFRRFAIESVYRSLAATAEVPWRRFKIPEDQFVQLVKLLRI